MDTNTTSINGFSWSRKETASLQISLSRWQVRKDAQWVGNMTNLTRTSLLAEQILPSLLCQGWISPSGRAEQRRHIVLRLTQELSELRRKELPHQFREEHGHTRKQAALRAFPFLTRCIYTQENAAHTQYRHRLERLHFHHQGQKKGTCF